LPGAEGRWIEILARRPLGGAWHLRRLFFWFSNFAFCAIFVSHAHSMTHLGCQRPEGHNSNCTITYAVNGKQYVAVLNGDGVSHTSGPLGLAPEIKPARGHNAIYVFALP
jgi:hypothetical protein